MFFTFSLSAGKEVRGIDADAKTHNAKRENFEKILAFLATQRVRTSTVTSRDLASGNLKSLMRLILSLASHYKPHSVKQGRDSGKPAALFTYLFIIQRPCYIVLAHFLPCARARQILLFSSFYRAVRPLFIFYCRWNTVPLLCPWIVRSPPRLASFRANSQTTPNLSVPTNRRFPSAGFEAPEEADIKTVNAVATLRRQNTHAGVGTKRPALGTSSCKNDRQMALSYGALFSN